jgi:hypothetical protein
MAEGRDLTWLTRPIAEAHRLGLKIMIKPHLAYWHSPFSWRGAIEFETEEEWDRFFTTYGAWVSELARICADADAFVVGTELDRTVAHEARWRSIIEQVRRCTDAPLTYAANWDAYQRVPFWDALDVIGVQAYFPLVEQDGLPDARQLEASWRRIATDLESFAPAVGDPPPRRAGCRGGPAPLPRRSARRRGGLGPDRRGLPLEVVPGRERAGQPHHVHAGDARRHRRALESPITGAIRSDTKVRLRTDR